MTGLELVSQALRLNDAAFVQVMALGGLRVALVTVFLAGLSNALGQSVVLFANEVTPRRFIASLLMGALVYVLGFLFLAASIWLVAQLLFERNEPFRDFLKVVGLAYAPYLFSAFILTPYLGSFISVTLSLWSLAAILVALTVTLELSIWQALLCSSLGWVLIQLLSRTLGRPLQALNRRSRRFVAGKQLELNAEGLASMSQKRRRR